MTHTPIRPQGPPPWPPDDPDVLAVLQQAHAEGAWGKYHGGYVERLERRLAEYHGVAHALTCGSGTFAVELALRALRIGPGDEVILAAYDYPGNFLSVHAVGAVPVLVDVSSDNLNLDPDRLEGAIGPKTKAVLCSHLHGGVIPMRRVTDIAARGGLSVVEDACQCPGATIEGRLAGTWGDVGVLSFGGSKLLTAGRGGAIVTRHADVLQRARLYQNRANVLCPLSELQAAVLLPQIEKLENRNAIRAANAAGLTRRLREVPGLAPFTNTADESLPGYYKLGMMMDAATFGLPRDRLTAAMRAEGIALDEGFRALHVGRSPARYRRGGDLTNAERAHEGMIILHHPILLGGPAEMDEIVRAFGKTRSER